MIVGVIALVGTLGCLTDERGARAALAAEGYAKVDITGWSAGCGNGDRRSTGFTGERNAMIVEGVVCRGWMKGATVRILSSSPVAPGAIPAAARVTDPYARAADALIARRATDARAALIDSLRTGALLLPAALLPTMSLPGGPLGPAAPADSLRRIEPAPRSGTPGVQP